MLPRGAAAAARITPRRTTTWAIALRTRASTTRRSPTTSALCAAAQLTPRPTTTWALRFRHGANLTRRSCATNRPRGSSPTTSRRTTTWATALRTGPSDEAIAAYHEALRIRPDEPRVLKCLAITLSRQEKFDQAVATFRQAVKLRPDFSEAWNDLGITLARQGKHRRGDRRLYRRRSSFGPDYRRGLQQHGQRLCATSGRFEDSLELLPQGAGTEARTTPTPTTTSASPAEWAGSTRPSPATRRCLELRPNHVDAHMNRALTWLRKGDYAQGWAEYEWRWKKRTLTNRPLISRSGTASRWRAGRSC